MIRGTTESSSCLKLILGAENDPDTAKGEKEGGESIGRGVVKGWAGGI